MTEATVHDYCRSFLFEHLGIRGAFVQLHDSWRKLQAGRAYPSPVRNLLGEMAAVTVLIAANLKQPGRMTFQLKGEGPVSLLFLDCDRELNIKGMARCPPQVEPAPMPDLLGHGQLVLTLDVAGLPHPYQSLVPLDGSSIAAIFEHYLERSEQQPARLVLAATVEVAAGLFLQKLPDADRLDADGWNRVTHLTRTLRAEELITLPTIKLLSRLFPEEDIRVFDPRPVRYHCPRDWAKIHQMLRGLGRDECEAILREHGVIHIQDEVCNQEYIVDAAALASLFAGTAETPP